MMIKVNLSPNRKRKRSAAGGGKGGLTLDTGVSPGSTVALIMMVGWLMVGGGLYYMLDQKQQETEAIKAESSRTKAEIKRIKEQIDEEYLQAVKARYEQLKTAIEKLEAEKRTPMFVMNELMNVLTQGKMPDIDEEEQRKRTTRDPDAELNPAWDATSVWINSFSEAGSVVSLKGGARDASDLSEFLKRLRASSRFSDVSHPEYKRVEVNRQVGARKLTRRFIEFSLTMRVSYWD